MFSTHCHIQLALRLLCPPADDPRLDHLPPPLPPPASNSSCLFTWCPPLYASCCSVLLYFSRYCSVQFSSVMSDFLWPHGLQHARLPCPSPTPGACSNSCPSSGWCHPAISSSVVTFSSHLQSFPASRSFPMSQFFPSGGQSIGASASASVLPMELQFKHQSFQWIFRTDFL